MPRVAVASIEAAIVRVVVPLLRKRNVGKNWLLEMGRVVTRGDDRQVAIS